MLKETDHDYQNCLVGNYYNSDMSGTFDSWEEFTEEHYGFLSDDFDDRYHFVFRYDIHKQDDGDFELELCIMLQRKGIYTHLNVKNISKEVLNGEVKVWLEGRADYIKKLWKEVI